jgi:hypothetical protein
MAAWRRALAAVAAALLIGGCSMETVVNAMTSEEDRRFAQAFVASARAGNEEWLREHSDPRFWDERGKEAESFSGHFPPQQGTTRLVGYQGSSQTVAGEGSTRRQRFVLVTEAGGSLGGQRGVETVARDDGPARIVGWSVAPSSERPAELAAFEASDKLVPWLRAFAAALFLVGGAIVWAFVRYRRRKRDAAAC